MKINKNIRLLGFAFIAFQLTECSQDKFAQYKNLVWSSKITQDYDYTKDETELSVDSEENQPEQPEDAQYDQLDKGVIRRTQVTFKRVLGDPAKVIKVTEIWTTRQPQVESQVQDDTTKPQGNDKQSEKTDNTATVEEKDEESSEVSRTTVALITAGSVLTGVVACAIAGVFGYPESLFNSLEQLYRSMKSAPNPEKEDAFDDLDPKWKKEISSKSIEELNVIINKIHNMPEGTMITSLELSSIRYIYQTKQRKLDLKVTRRKTYEDRLQEANSLPSEDRLQEANSLPSIKSRSERRSSLPFVMTGRETKTDGWDEIHGPAVQKAKAQVDDGKLVKKKLLFKDDFEVGLLSKKSFSIPLQKKRAQDI